MQKEHENYKELIWMLAKTDFKLRYQGSFLGYIWAILQPLLLFLVLNAVFSGMFGRGARGGGVPFYSLQLLVALMIYTFFSEGTNAGLNALKSKSQMIKKIYVPRWSIIIASTLQTFMVFGMNVIVIILFFAWYKYVPSFSSILFFISSMLIMYFIILSFALVASPLVLYFRDLSMIWQVLLRMMFYTMPILYPLSLLPEWSHKIVLMNPIAFIIHFIKVSMFENRYPEVWQLSLFFGTVVFFFILSIWIYRKIITNVAEKL